jgi:apolipoprotein N-acyltransferase
MTISRARLILLACASGLLYPLSFPAFDLGIVAWFALVPLHIAVEYLSPGRAFRIGWLSGTLAFTGSMFWVITAMNVYGKVPFPIATLVMLLLTVYLGLYMAVYAGGLSWIRTAFPTLGFLPAPFLWVTLELIRTYFLSGLPWALFGYSQYQWLPIIQLADHFGVYGVSFLLVLVNSALAETIIWGFKAYRGFQIRSFPWPSSVAATAGFSVALFYGTTLLSSVQHVPTRTLSVGVVQPNVEQAQKWDVAFRQETMARYDRLTAGLGDNLDLIVWPEAATPFVFEMEPQYRAVVNDMARRAGAPLLFGSPALRRHPDGRPFLLNSAYLLATDGQILGRYDKQHLVPFGEYIPFHNSFLFFLDKLVEGIGDFEAGPGSTLLMFKPREKNPPAVTASHPHRFPREVRRRHLLRSDLPQPRAAVCGERSRFHGHGHERCLVRSVVGALSTFRHGGLSCRGKSCRLRASGQHRHLRLHRSLRACRATVTDLHAGSAQRNDCRQPSADLLLAIR